MSVLKNLTLALLLTLTAPALAADVPTWTRTEYVQECERSGHLAKKPDMMVNAVCNCAGQLASFVLTKGRTEWSDYTLRADNPLAGEAVQYCVQAYESSPELFLKKFATLTVGDGTKEAR